MLEIKMTVNGKPFNQFNFKSEMEKTIFEGAAETAKNAILESLNEDEQSQVSIDVVGENLESLSLKVKGPDEIVAKVEKAMS